MHAIIFDLEVAELKKHYGDPCDPAYADIEKELKALGFERAQGDIYLNESGENSLTSVYQAMSRLSQIDWFAKSVRDIRAFRVEDWSDFTAIVKSSRKAEAANGISSTWEYPQFCVGARP